MSFRWRSIMFLVLFCFILVKISEIQLVCDRRTGGRTDISSYRDARTHLKRYRDNHEREKGKNTRTKLKATVVTDPGAKRRPRCQRMSVSDSRRKVAGAELPIVVAAEFSLDPCLGGEDGLATDERHVAGGSGCRRRTRTRRHGWRPIRGRVEPT